MTIGDMKFRLTLQSPPTTTANELGEVEPSPAAAWVTVDEVWAGIRPLSSGEIIRARAVQLDTTHKVGIRYYPGLTSQWRLRDALTGAVYNIKGVIDPTMEQVEMVLDCVVSTNG